MVCGVHEGLGVVSVGGFSKSGLVGMRVPMSKDSPNSTDKSTVSPES